MVRVPANDICTWFASPRTIGRVKFNGFSFVLYAHGSRPREPLAIVKFNGFSFVLFLLQRNIIIIVKQIHKPNV